MCTRFHHVWSFSKQQINLVQISQKLPIKVFYFVEVWGWGVWKIRLEYSESEVCLVFRDVTSCSSVRKYQRFGRTCCHHFNDKNVLSWRYKQHLSPKHWYVRNTILLWSLWQQVALKRPYPCPPITSPSQYEREVDVCPCLWVPVTTAWRVLRLRMGERPPVRRVAANILNKQSQTANKGWSSSLGVGRGANNSSPWKTKLFWNTHGRDASSGDKTIRR